MKNNNNLKLKKQQQFKTETCENRKIAVFIFIVRLKKNRVGVGWAYRFELSFECTCRACFGLFFEFEFSSEFDLKSMLGSNWASLLTDSKSKNLPCGFMQISQRTWKKSVLIFFYIRVGTSFIQKYGFYWLFRFEFACLDIIYRLVYICIIYIACDI